VQRARVRDAISLAHSPREASIRMEAYDGIGSHNLPVSDNPMALPSVHKWIFRFSVP